MNEPSITLLADAAKLLEMASRALNEEQAKLKRLLASDLVARAHAEAELVEDDVAFKVA